MAETLTLDAELEQAKELAQRYQFEFIDLRDFRPDLEFLRSIPLEHMVHYEFLPLEAPDHSLLVIAVADPTDLARLDELEAKLDRRLVVKVAAPSQVRDFLKKTDPSQRVLDKATEDFRVEVIHDEENGEPGLSLEEMVQDREVSPMIRLVDSIIFAALERRASDIHIESRDDSVAVKYRVDGVVLVTGPTGSGKTTTLYAALSEIKSEEDKIITIEDPVEYQIRGITQIPVNEKKGLTFARGLRSILRHDPDKIMVGEIRDNETAQIAIQSALTGHLVFTTVHANNVVDVLGRFLNMGVEPYNFVSALNCILAQRLVRLICEPCKRPVETPVELFEESGIKPEEWQGVVFYEGAGCPRCNQTGFRGRTAVGELLELSDRIRELILDKRPSSEIRRAAHDEGMVSLRESALERVRLGLTTLKDINKVTFVE